MTTTDYFNSCISIIENTPFYYTVISEYNKTKNTLICAYITVVILLVVIIILMGYTIYKK